MPSTSKEIQLHARKLNKLLPTLAKQSRVEQSTRHAEKHGDKGADGNNERRIGSHILRLERLMDRPGVEKKVWDSALKELVINEEAIPESYWEQQQQIARDNGHGDIRINTNQKRGLTEQLQDAQRTGLESWRGYLEQAGDQYPIWFKLYAWDGMSHLGTFDKTKRQYTKRSSGTVAPYPQLNPAALAHVYDSVKSESDTDQEPAQLAKFGNFNKLYSHMLLDQKAILPTPENPEDVEGEWQEYTQDQIKEITEAAQGTPWCIAGEGMAQSYTRDGGKFLLFHLRDPETGALSSTACASIRLDQHGNVVELSGLKGGSSQHLEDSLVPTVEDKVKNLPGGEKYLAAFEDKQKLIVMDKKFQAGEPFNEEELMFLYEVENPIKYIGKYAHDPRPAQFKTKKSDHLKILEAVYGEDAQDMLLPSVDVNRRFEEYLRQGRNPNILAHKASSVVKAHYILELLDAGATVDADEVAEQLPAKELLKYYERLTQAGATIDPDELAGRFDPYDKLKNIKRLKELGASFDVDEFVLNDSVHIKPENITDILQADGTPSILMEKLSQLNPRYYNYFAQYGSDRELMSLARGFIEGGVLSEEFFALLDANVDETYLRSIRNSTSRESISALLGAGLSPDAVAKYVDSWEVNRRFDLFIEKGATPNGLMDGLGSYHTSQNIDKLIKSGADIQDVVQHITEPKYVFDHLDELNAHGANLDAAQVVAKMAPGEVISKIKKILEKDVNVDIDEVIKKAKVGDVSEHMVDDLLEAGADLLLVADKISINRYVSKYTYDQPLASLRNYPELNKRLWERIQEARS